MRHPLPLKPGIALQQVEEGIYSVINPSEQHHHYDRLAAGYDLIIGNSIYNRLLWGNWPSDYSRFCAAAVGSADGWYLDAGCGTLVFSASAYAGSKRPMVLLDRSLGMLRRARKRLYKLCGKLPEHITLLQGDVYHLPFAEQSFDTVASFGTLHLFDQLPPLLEELRRVKRQQGQMFLSSLVREHGLGRYYYDLLVRSGEIAAPRDSKQLQEAFHSLGLTAQFATRGNMCNITERLHNSATPNL